MRRSLLVLTAAALLAGCGGGGSGSGSASTGGATPAPAELTPQQRQTILASLPAPYNAADLENGRRAFGACRSCHSIAPSGENLIGPHLYGVFGRRAGSVNGFEYSDAVRNAGFTWDFEHLDHWLDNPRTFLPGTRMSFAGLHDADRRRDLIAYLRVEGSPPPAP